MTISGDYDKMEEMKPINGVKTLKFTSSKSEKVRWLSYLAELKCTLFVFVEGDRSEMASRESMVRAFLGGLKKKE